jgi:polyphosphate glucokinase
MEVLVIDVGGTRVKFRLSRSAEVRRFRSSPDLTPEQLVQAVKTQTSDWQYDVISIGYPGPVGGGAPTAEHGKLGSGWVDYDFPAAFGRPVRVVNDAILQALGSYRSGRMLYFGLGTGVASALVSEHVLIPLELGCLPHPLGGTFVDHFGRAGRRQWGHEAWQASVVEVLPQVRAALAADYVVLGGGNGRKVEHLPPLTCHGGRHDAFEGGVRLWEDYVEPHDAEAPRVWRVVR